MAGCPGHICALQIQFTNWVSSPQLSRLVSWEANICSGHEEIFLVAQSNLFSTIDNIDKMTRLFIYWGPCYCTLSEITKDMGKAWLKEGWRPQGWAVYRVGQIGETLPKLTARGLHQVLIWFVGWVATTNLIGCDIRERRTIHPISPLIMKPDNIWKGISPPCVGSLKLFH